MADALISVVALRKAFGPHVVLDDIHLEVRPGEAVALLGANGAGKTTLLRILATLMRPSRGRATIAGFDCAREAERVRRVTGVVAHGAWLYDDLTALENLRYWTTLAGQRLRAEPLRAALAAVDLDAVADARVRTFSAGMKRRLTLARVTLGRPRALLLDEPFGALDERGRKWLETYLTSFKADGGAVLMATHGFGRGLAAADRAAILAGGRIAYQRPLGSLDAEDLRHLCDLAADAAPR